MHDPFQSVMQHASPMVTSNNLNPAISTDLDLDLDLNYPQGYFLLHPPHTHCICETTVRGATIFFLVQAGGKYGEATIPGREAVGAPCSLA